MSPPRSVSAPRRCRHGRAERPSVLPEISIVAPLHNEAGNVGPLFEAIRAAVEPLGRPFEVLLVNDGSTDATGRLLDEIAAADPRLSPVHLDGNFGEARRSAPVSSRRGGG